MFNLISVVLSIALTAVFLLISVNYLNPSNQSAVNYGKMSVSGFEAIQSAYRQATSPASTAFGVNPTSPLVDSNPPSSMSGLTALHNVLPTTPPGYTWGYGTNSLNQPYACLYGSSNGSAVYKGLLQASLRFGSQFSVLPGSAGCASLSTGITAPQNTAVTSYVGILKLQSW